MSISRLLVSAPFLACLSVSLLGAGTGCSATPSGSPDGGAGGGGGGGGETANLTETQGCDASVKLYASPEDPSEHGPWAVGVRTVYEGGVLGEVLYPAVPGSDAGKEKVTYALYDTIPPDLQAKLHYESPPIQTGNAYRDLPMDDAHGPYPVIVYVEGRYGIKTEAFSHMAHWASRGFVVVAIDMPGVKMADQITGNFVFNIPASQEAVLNTLTSPAGDSAFLAGRLDMSRIAMVGHGEAAMWMGQEPGVKVNVVWSPICSEPSVFTPAETLLVLGNTGDLFYPGYTKPCYEYPSVEKHLVAIGSSKGRIGDDLCWIRDPQGAGFPEALIPYGPDSPQNMDIDLACTHGRPEEEIAPVIDFASTAVLEEKLMCKSADVLGGIQQKYMQVSEFLSSGN